MLTEDEEFQAVVGKEVVSPLSIEEWLKDHFFPISRNEIQQWCTYFYLYYSDVYAQVVSVVGSHIPSEDDIVRVVRPRLKELAYREYLRECQFKRMYGNGR